MTHTEIEGISLLRCEDCAGVWIGEGALGELFKTSARAPDLSELIIREDGSPHRPCRICQEPMDLAWLGSLQIDWCAAHGLWFDPEELQRARAGNIHPDLASNPNEEGAELVRAIVESLSRDRSRSR